MVVVNLHHRIIFMYNNNITMLIDEMITICEILIFQ